MHEGAELHTQRLEERRVQSLKQFLSDGEAFLRRCVYNVDERAPVGIVSGWARHTLFEVARAPLQRTLPQVARLR
jgi:hypothetical protein